MFFSISCEQKNLLPAAMDRSSVPVVVMLLVVPVLAMDLFGDLFAKRTLRTLPRGFVSPCARRATSRMFVASSPSGYCTDT